MKAGGRQCNGWVRTGLPDSQSRVELQKIQKIVFEMGKANEGAGTGLADSRIKVLKSTKQFWDKENNLDKYGYLELPSDNVESSLSFEPREAIIGRPSLSLSFEEMNKLTWPPLSLHSNPFS